MKNSFLDIAAFVAERLAHKEYMPLLRNDVELIIDEYVNALSNTYILVRRTDLVEQHLQTLRRNTTIRSMTDEAYIEYCLRSFAAHIRGEQFPPLFKREAKVLPE